ncbi:MAG: DNA cytosine methyltransferase [Tagaea sp.]|nr:DNA cytosine methyltransferase [Tagaea sp.]
MARTLISLYTGVGGLDFGFEAAGFRTAVAVEWDRTACATIRLNRPRWAVIEGDIDSVDSDSILKTAGLRAGEADALIAGPPCQPFSKSGYWKLGDARRLDDPRANTLSAFLRVLRDARPKTFLLENVAGLAFKGKDEGLRFLVAGIAEVNRQAGTNYSVNWASLNAAAFGVPQLRERVFLVGQRDGASFVFPNPDYGPAREAPLLDARPPYRTVWDAIGDLAEQDAGGLAVGGKWADLLPSIPEGRNYLHHTPRGEGLPLFGWRTRYWSFLLKLAKDHPSWTIQAQPGPATGPFHWLNRRLSDWELCRLQTFPDKILFNCGRTEIQRMVGNAVPSLLAERIALEMRWQLLGDRRRQAAPKLLPPDRGRPPQPEKVAKVPARFRTLASDHPEHPGEGLGVGAARRLAAA